MNSNPSTVTLVLDKYKYIGHSIFWLIYIGIAIFHYYYTGIFESVANIITVTLIDAISIYLIVIYLLPNFLLNKKKVKKFWALFTITIILNVTINFMIQNFIFESFDNCINSCILKQSYSLHHSFLFIVIAFGTKIYKHNLQFSREINNYESNKIQSELEYLKLQMNPHFLFNTLNSLYIQSKVDSKMASETIMKLSDILRYQIYECSNPKVFIKAEYDYIVNYLDLQKIRYNKLQIEVEQKGRFSGYMIYPFILISFVEDAIKFGVDNTAKNNYIKVIFEIVEKKLIFSVENSKNISNLQKNSQQESAMKNIKNRLKTLYGDDFSLKTIESEISYFVKLEIKLEL